GLKVTIAAGSAHRFQVGDPAAQLFDCIVGGVIDRLGIGEHLCRTGDILVDHGVAERLGTQLRIEDWREDPEGGGRFARVKGIATEVPKRPWKAITDDRLAPDALRAWILPPLYERVRSGRSRFLAEFRTVASVFAKFGDLDYD